MKFEHREVHGDLVGGDIAEEGLVSDQENVLYLNLKLIMAMSTSNFKLLETFTTIISKETSTSLIL